MTYRDYYQKTGGSINFCRPYRYDNGNALAVSDEYGVVGMILNGKDIDQAEIANRLEEFSRSVNKYYDDYSGWKDLNLHVAIDGVSPCECRDCPWFSECQAMDEEMDDEP